MGLWVWGSGLYKRSVSLPSAPYEAEFQRHSWLKLLFLIVFESVNELPLR